MTKQEEKIRKDLEVPGVNIEKITDEGWYFSINLAFAGDVFQSVRPYIIEGLVKRENDIFVIVSIEKEDL